MTISNIKEKGALIKEYIADRDMDEWVLEIPDLVETMQLIMEIPNNTPYDLDYYFYVNGDFDNSNYHYSYWAANPSGYGNGGGNYADLTACFANEHAIWDIAIGIKNGYFDGVAIGECKSGTTTYIVMQAMRYLNPIDELNTITIRAIEGGTTQRTISKGTIISGRMW